MQQGFEPGDVSAGGSGDARALLEHRDFLHALARSLLRDPHDAEDLVQETWVAALERSPRPLGAPRAWLARVARNLAGRGAWRERERGAREREVARPEATPSDEAERDFAVGLALADALRSLGEPYRTAVHLRYWRGLGPREIASELGVPEDTVKTRLRRALAELRDRLDAGHDGVRGLWVAPLAALLERTPAPTGGAEPVPAQPAAQPPAHPTGAPNTAPASAGLSSSVTASAALWSGVLSMKAIGITLVSLGATLALFLGLRGDGRERESALPAPSSPSAPEVAAADGVGGAQVPARVERNAVTRGPASTAPRPALAVAPRSARVRVVDELGIGIEGARVTLGDERAATDGRGRASLPLRADGETREVELAVAAVGFVPLKRSAVLDSEPEQDLGLVSLARGGRVEGRVVDVRGRAVAGARVFAAAPQDLLYRQALREPARPRTDIAGPDATTDDAGEFALDGLRPGPLRVWAATEDALLGFSPILRVEPGGLETELVVRVEPPVADDEISGVVVLADGLDPAAASVWCRRPFLSPTGAREARTQLVSVQANGRFRVQLSEREPHDLWVAPSSMEHRGVVAYGVAPGTLDLVLTAESAPTVRVLALDASGDGLDPFEMVLEVIDGTSSQVRNMATIAGGADTRLPLPASSFTLTVRADGHDQVRLGPFDPSSVPDPLTAVLAPLPRVTGRVSAGGEPLSGARVEISFATDDLESVTLAGFSVRRRFPTAAVGRSEPDGTWSLMVREPGSYFVRASAPGWAPAELGPLRVDPSRGREGLALELVRGGTLEGRVLASARESSAGVIVGISNGDLHPRTQLSDADGRFRFEHLTPGDWLVIRAVEEIAQAPTRAAIGRGTRPVEWSGNCTVRDGETTYFELDLRLSAPAILRGRLSVDGESLEGWTAELFTSDERFFEGGDSADSIPLDQHGRFELVSPEPGEHRIYLRGGAFEDGALQVVARASVPPGGGAWSFALATGHVEARFSPGVLPENGVPVFVWSDARANLAGAALLPNSDGTWTARVPAGRGRIVYAVLPLADRNPLAWPVLGEVEVPQGGLASFSR